MAAQKTQKRKNSSPSKAGRRTGETTTRNDILTAAKNLFAEHGFEGTSMRAIAAHASVDPALIRHFFGNKEALFAQIISEQFALANQMRDSFHADQSNRGRAVVAAYLQMWNSKEIKPLLLGLVRSAISSSGGNEKMREAAWELFSTGPFGPGKTNIDPIAFSLMSSQLLGLAVGRYLMELPHLTSLSDQRIINELSPVIQRYIDGTYTEMNDAVQVTGTRAFAPTVTQEAPTVSAEPTPPVGATSPLEDAQPTKDAQPTDTHEVEQPASVEDTTDADNLASAAATELPQETVENSASAETKAALDSDAAALSPEDILLIEELPAEEPADTPDLPTDDYSPSEKYRRPDALENAHEPTLFEDSEAPQPAPKKSKKKEAPEDQLSLFDGLF